MALLPRLAISRAPPRCSFIGHAKSLARCLSSASAASFFPPSPPPSHPATFIPRPTFSVPHSITSSYFLGHHKAGLSKMKELVGSVDLIIECRDYRVPLSSRNPLFEETLQGKERVVVYTKRDLGMEVLDERTRNIMTKWHKPSKAMFSNMEDRKDIKKIVSYAQEVARQTDTIVGTRVLIVGMPNVGKSTLLNALRRVGTGNATKAAITGNHPGVTRKLSNTVRISSGTDPLIYVIDTPGVFVPYMPNGLTMLKLALVGSIKDSLIPTLTLADFLLYNVNKVDPGLYSAWSEPTNDVIAWLREVARKTGKLGRGGEEDLEAAAVWMVGRYRKGLMGRFMLDEVREGGLEEWLRGEGRVVESMTAARKRIVKERNEARRKKAMEGKGKV
ncbi:P-loop containing nucleoside triphosphate hydrolase protein [Wilcoxina mikolae CBS 423.85]|nr:P-loop containing nucleoside triphosphate hydrolase protein [Wilcoxina mikolae CBS 423.85]